MMRRIDLLPTTYVERQRQRRAFGLVIVAGLFVLLLLLVWWVRLGFDISDKEQELQTVQTDNERLRVQIAQLQEFALLEQEAIEKRTALITVMAGDVDWPVIMTEVAMAVPGEVWLESMTASAGQTEGATPVGTETAPVDISAEAPFGRIQFTGKALSMPGVAKWMIRQEISKRFEAVFLNDANRTSEDAATEIFDFDSTLELNGRGASDRFTDQSLERP
jgi:Tfp pilus assembly protein PilN